MPGRFVLFEKLTNELYIHRWCDKIGGSAKSGAMTTVPPRARTNPGDGWTVRSLQGA